MEEESVATTSSSITSMGFQLAGTVTTKTLCISRQTYPIWMLLPPLKNPGSTAINVYVRFKILLHIAGHGTGKQTLDFIHKLYTTT